MIFENVIIPHSIGAPVGNLLGIVAFLLPFVAGAASAIKSQRILTGLRVGFWSGAISGLIVLCDSTASCEIVVRREPSAHRIGQHRLFVRIIEIHVYNPSTARAMRFFCTSLVPP